MRPHSIVVDSPLRNLSTTLGYVFLEITVVYHRLPDLFLAGWSRPHKADREGNFINADLECLHSSSIKNDWLNFIVALHFPAISRLLMQAWKWMEGPGLWASSTIVPPPPSRIPQWKMWGWSKAVVDRLRELCRHSDYGKLIWNPKTKLPCGLHHPLTGILRNILITIDGPRYCTLCQTQFCCQIADADISCPAQSFDVIFL